MWAKFCSLCGVVLERVSDERMPVGALPWLKEVRAVRSVLGTSSPFLTGVGFLEENNRLVAHPDETIRYSDSTGRLETHWLLYESKEYWAYPFHDACWNLLLARVIGGNDNGKNWIIQHLFNIFYCTPSDKFKLLTPGHDYGGAIRFQNGSPVPDTGTWSYLTANPNEMFPMAWLPSSAEPISLIEPPAASDFEPFSPADIFSRLPTEIVMVILSSLPSVDICTLRLSSRVIARMSQPTLLPQHFWSSRFEKQFEMGFVFAGTQCPSGSDQRPDWRRIYSMAKTALWDANDRPGFRNRRRIWHILGDIFKTVSPLLADEPTFDLQLAFDDTALRSENDVPVIQPRYDRVFSAELFPEDGVSEDLPAVCRKLETKTLIWPSTSCLGNLSIGVSFIWFNSRFYVAGLRIRDTGTSGGGSDGSAMGRIIPSTERLIVFEHLDRLEGVEVAITASGIIGLKFLVERANIRFCRIAGDVDATLPDIGIGRLHFRSDRRLFAVTAGFDIYKFVSLQFIESDLPKAAFNISRTSDMIPADGLQFSEVSAVIEDRIWTPGFPSNVNSMRSVPAVSVNQVFSRYLNMDFGGAGGYLLASLQRIVAIMFGWPAVFLGLDFVYNDGRNSFYGTRTVVDRSRVGYKGIEVSFYIDGAKGERISCVEVEYCTNGGGVRSIQIRENELLWLCYSHFPGARMPPCFGSEGRHWKSSNIGTNWGNRKVFFVVNIAVPKETSKISSTLKPLNGEVITGFFALLGVYDNSFQTFGIQSQRMGRGKIPITPLNNPLLADKSSVQQDFPDIGTYIMRSRDLSLAYTTARLQDIRRIRISYGAPGHCRLSQHISGLYFEYHNSHRPGIVGQWIMELDSWELSVSERITEISLWFSDEWTRPQRHPMGGGKKLGKATGIRFKTSFGNIRQFGRDCPAGNVCLEYRRNQFEELDSIIWAFNSDWDHARVIYSQRPVQNDLSPNFIAYGPDPWEVPEILLWQDTEPNGNSCTVTSIQISSVCDAITGISFIYTSGFALTLGSQEGEACSFHVAAEEELIRVAFGSYFPGPINIVSFYTNLGRELTQQAHSPLGNWEHDIGRVHPETHHEMFVFNLHPFSNALSPPAGCKVHGIPHGAGRFVGLWGVLGRKERRIKRLGPLFMGSVERKRGFASPAMNADPVIIPADNVGYAQSGFDIVPIAQDILAPEPLPRF